MGSRAKSSHIGFALALSTAAAALGGLLFGFDTAVIAGTTQALTRYFHLTSVTLGATVSCALWGTVAGCSVAAYPAERLGCRDSLRIVGLLYIVSALGCSLSHDWYVFMLFRFIGGLAIGGCSIFAPMYIAETSPAAIRGKLVACFQLSIVIGILAAYSSNFAIDLMHLGSFEWRAQLGVAAIPSLLFFVALAFIQRSPRWLVKKNRITEAQRSLKTFGFADSATEIRRIQESLQLDSAKRGASILAPAYRRPLLIALALGLFNQLSGINAVLYYINDIFAQAGFASISASGQSILVGISNLLFTFIGMALIDHVGRKPLLLVGALGMASTLGGIAAIFLNGHHQALLLPLVIAYTGFFAASQGTVVWVYLSEIFPNAVRNSGQSFASFWLWLVTAIIAGVYPTMAAASSGFSFLFFCAAMIVQFFVVLAFFPETKGRSLEEIPAGAR